MKKNDFLTKTLLFGAFALATAACSNEELTVVDPNINSGDDAPKLSITVKAPAGEGVIVRNATRADIQDSYESALKSINVYLFQCATESGQETDYKYQCTLTFKAAADDNGTIAWQEGSNGKTCVTAIPAELMGKYVRMAIVANDAPYKSRCASTSFPGVGRNTISMSPLSITTIIGSHLPAAIWLSRMFCINP